MTSSLQIANSAERSIFLTRMTTTLEQDTEISRVGALQLKLLQDIRIFTHDKTEIANIRVFHSLSSLLQVLTQNSDARAKVKEMMVDFDRLFPVSKPSSVSTIRASEV